MSALTIHQPIDELPHQLTLFPSVGDREVTDHGLYFQLSFDEYRAIPAINQSVLKLVIADGSSPKHARASFDGKLRFDSDAMRLGRAEHAWIIEGEESFRESFVVSTPCMATITSKTSPRLGGECGNNASCLADGKWYCKTHAPKGAEQPSEYVSQEREQAIRLMCESVRTHEISQHLTRPGWTEGVIVYDVPVEYAIQHIDEQGNPHVESFQKNMRHKIRFDKLGKPTKNRPHILIDLKRMPVLKGSRRSRERAIEDYGWDVQAAMYTEAVKSHYGVSECDYVWIFVEEKYPHDVVWFPADENTLRIGSDKLWRARTKWAVCEHTGVWTGICEGEQFPGGLSQFSVKDYMKKYADSEGRLASEVLTGGVK